MKQYLEEKLAQVDEALQSLMPPEGARPERLTGAMRYSLFAGGKRVRPILALAASEAACGDPARAIHPACAVELVHTYSLIHDDLPAMDDDDFRRGKPTCHVAFDEATAILAGDALLTMAFEILTADSYCLGIETPARLKIAAELGRAAGWKGMVGGQQVDMESEGSEPQQPVVEYIHTHKTGAMIRASVLMGALAAGASEEQLKMCNDYGEKLGLAFQVVDDILDVTATTEQMGKDQGSDAARGKITYTALFGVEGARERAVTLIDDAKSAVAGLDSAGRLAGIADYVLLRRL
jgi:geranylgeranyl diphosphate synthase type II